METLKMKFNYPFAAACDRLREDALHRGDYDVTALFRWGSMLGMAVLRMLEASERDLGKAGQKAMTEALVGVGREMGRQMLDGIELPPRGVEPIELISAYASWINREVYASPEAPRIEDENHCSFDILWCPHQDAYAPFDCRVQRYLVEGMIDALRERVEGADFNIKVVQTIPAGGKVCTFQIWRKGAGEEDDWKSYSDRLAKKALGKKP